MDRKLLKTTSDKKQKLIDAKNASSFVVGETVVILQNLISSYPTEERKDKTMSVDIVKVNQKTLIVQNPEYYNRKSEHKINKTDVLSRDLRNVGANVFNEKFDGVRPVAFTLESILFNLNILGTKRGIDDGYEMNGKPVGDCNWNPFIYDKNGNKQYYQRDFVWSLKDKQLLIDSVYNGIDCGKILVRKRAWKSLEAMALNGETELFFNDIVDGKQRLDAIRGFIMNEYTDSYGNYYSDLSFMSQHKFTQHQLFMFAEMPETATDKETIYQFLKMNFTGVPQSQEHIDLVKEISNKF